MGDVSTIQRPSGSVAKQGDQVGELVSAGWTNNSHDMYISSMEATFMQQLRGQQLQHHHAHAPDMNMTHVAGHGFKALQVQDGASNELMSERNVPRSRHVGVRGLPQDPWARRSRPHKDSGVNRRGDVVCASADDGESGTDTARKTARTHGREADICAGENLVGNNSSEASGQNFAQDEVHSTAQPSKSCKKRRPDPSKQILAEGVVTGDIINLADSSR